MVVHNLPVLASALGYNLNSLVGLTGAPTVESVVNYLKDQWRVSAKLAPFVSLLVAVILNLGLGILFNIDLYSSVVTGMITGFVASGWYEATKKLSPPAVENTQAVVVK